MTVTVLRRASQVFYILSLSLGLSGFFFVLWLELGLWDGDHRGEVPFWSFESSCSQPDLLLIVLIYLITCLCKLLGFFFRKDLSLLLFIYIVIIYIIMGSWFMVKIQCFVVYFAAQIVSALASGDSFSCSCGHFKMLPLVFCLFNTSSACCTYKICPAHIVSSSLQSVQELAILPRSPGYFVGAWCWKPRSGLQVNELCLC